MVEKIDLKILKDYFSVSKELFLALIRKVNNQIIITYQIKVIMASHQNSSNIKK